MTRERSARAPPAPSLVDGAWLGVDVGQRRSKVYAFSLIEARGGSVRVSFERGAWRPLLDGESWPRGDAGVFEDLARPSRLSAPAERCARAIIDHSEAVARWRRASGGTTGLCVDAPAGFAREGSTCRETERCSSRSFRTESEWAFVAAMARFAKERNPTPLRQRYYWKLVGRLALAHLAALLGARVTERDLDRVARRSAVGAGTGSAGPVTRALRVRRVPGEPSRVREGFPSETYSRANGATGELAAEPRALLAALVASPWSAIGNAHGRRSSRPPSAWMAALERQRGAVGTELAVPGPLASMVKIPGDPGWADLWDAFACAFTACCEAHGCAVLIGGDASLLLSEGAILAPLTMREAGTPSGLAHPAANAAPAP